MRVVVGEVGGKGVSWFEAILHNNVISDNNCYVT